MKRPIILLFLAGLLFFNISFAQKIDSTFRKIDSVKKFDYFSKYKTIPALLNSPKINDKAWTKKQEPLKIESHYKMDNGRIVGGETIFKLGKKNQ